MSEENKYTIKVNPKIPSSGEIQKKMNFEGAYKAYTHKAYRTPWARFQRHSPKNRKASMFIILTIVVGTLVFLEDEENKTDVLPITDEPTHQIDSLNVPKKGVDTK
jgi:hypothetical protein